MNALEFFCIALILAMLIAAASTIKAEPGDVTIEQNVVVNHVLFSRK